MKLLWDVLNHLVNVKCMKKSSKSKSQILAFKKIRLIEVPYFYHFL